MGALDQTGIGTKLLARGTDAAAIAGQHAVDVDKQGRFPDEAVAAMKYRRLLGAMLPIEFGGEGASLADVAEICSLIGQQCSSAGMVYAMHQIQVSSLMLLAHSSDWCQTFLRRIADKQLLLASATSEAGVGGALFGAGHALGVAGVPKVFGDLNLSCSHFYVCEWRRDDCAHVVKCRMWVRLRS